MRGDGGSRRRARGARGDGPARLRDARSVGGATASPASSPATSSRVHSITPATELDEAPSLPAGSGGARSCAACGARGPAMASRPRRALTLSPRAPKRARRRRDPGVGLVGAWAGPWRLAGQRPAAFALLLVAFGAGSGPLPAPRLVAAPPRAALLPLRQPTPYSPPSRSTYAPRHAATCGGWHPLAVANETVHPCSGACPAWTSGWCRRGGSAMMVTGNVTVHPPATIDRATRRPVGPGPGGAGRPARYPAAGDSTGEIVVPIGARVEVSGRPSGVVAGVAYAARKPVSREPRGQSGCTLLRPRNA